MASLPVYLSLLTSVQFCREGCTGSGEERRGTSASPIRSVDSSLMNKGTTDVSAKLLSQLDWEFKYDLKGKRPNNAWGSWPTLWFHRKEYNKNKLSGDGQWWQFSQKVTGIQAKYVYKETYWTQTNSWKCGIKEVTSSEVNTFPKALAFFLIVLEVKRALPLKIKQKDPIRYMRCFFTNLESPFISSSRAEIYAKFGKGWR